jgi:hypothetical protein
METKCYLLALVALLCIVAMPATAGNWSRPTTTATITTLPTQAYNLIVESFGGNTTVDSEANATMNWTMFLTGDLATYTGIMGDLALVIIIAMPFIGMYLMHQDLVPAAIGGMIVGAALLVFVPAQFRLLGGVFIILGVVTVVYRLFTDR